jgi:hypothetical protein
MSRWPDRTLEQRFWSHVDKSGECWLWTASGDSHGYGQMRVGTKPGKLWPAHRLSWSIANGPIPEGQFIDHLCFSPRCVRPSHLRLATNKEYGASAGARQPKSGVPA